MILLAGADIVLPDRLLSGGSLLIDGERIAALEARIIDAPAGATRVDASGLLAVPGYVDVHVHGVEGHDVLDGPDGVVEVARRLPRFGVTAFCPTSIACDAITLRTLLGGMVRTREALDPQAARVLPAHLESNFINPAYRGAQPLECIRGLAPSRAASQEGSFTGRDILAAIADHREQVGIVTVAPEIDGGLDLVGELVAAGHIVSVGHSGATYQETLEAFAAGISHATHLFNRTSRMNHRAPGVPGAVLRAHQVKAELICDGVHVHPAVMQLAIGIKGSQGIMAITDGTAGAGLPVGSRTLLGGRPIVVTDRSVELLDGTLAGSVLTMDRAFQNLVLQAGASVVDAARMCATTPAEQLGARDWGRIAVGARADLVLLNQDLTVRATYLAGRLWGSRD